MALIHCPECGKAVSDKAVQCIHCGYPLPVATEGIRPERYVPVDGGKKLPGRRMVAMLVAVALLVAGVAMVLAASPRIAFPMA